MTAEIIAKALGDRRVGGGWITRCPARGHDCHGGKVLVEFDAA
jgi:hypothetical protein